MRVAVDVHRMRGQARRVVTLTLASAVLFLPFLPAAQELHASEGPDNDPITINVSGPASVAEGETATYTISLSPPGVIPPPGANFAVNYRTVAGTATQLNQKNRNVADYDWVDAIHTFSADNPGPVEVSVTTFDDNRVEQDETFSFKISEGYFAMGGNDDRLRPRFGTSAVSTTITSDDVVGTDISLSVSPSVMTEDDEATSVVVTATLEGETPATADIPVAIELGGTAEKGSDYTVKAALSSITIPANSNSGSGTLTLAPIDDTAVEVDEVVTVSGSATGLTVDPAQITILSQMSDRAVLSISGPSGKVEEGGDAVFDATLSNLVSSEITVEWRGQSPDCCDFAEPSDYGSGHVEGRYPRGSFTIPANTLRHTFTIPVNDDDLAEPEERFAILIGVISGAGLAPDAISAPSNTFAARAFATIAASDSITVNLSGPATVDEGGEAAAYTVSLAGEAPVGDLTVNYATSDGTAEAGADYGAESGTLTFTPDDYADKTFTVQITDDTLEEGDETFNVVLSSASGGGGRAPVLGTSSVTTTIRSVAPVSAPGRPSGLSAQVDASGIAIALTWEAPADGSTLSGYQVLRRAPATEANFVVLADDTGSTETAYTDTTATPKTSYVYRVRAVNAHGESQTSKPAQVFFRPVMPGRPSGLSAQVDDSGTAIVLTWDAPVDGSTLSGYQVLRRATATESNLVVLADDTGSTDTTYIDSTAAPDTKYVYRVRARNDAGLGQVSRPAYIVAKGN